MRKIGFITSRKENEKRRALTYEDLLKLKNKEYLYFEKGYFEYYGYHDEDIINAGSNVFDYDKLLTECDVLVEPKIGDSTDLEKMNNKILFGWIHATQNKNITDSIINQKNTAIAFEKMYDKDYHLFSENNKIAGIAAIYHSMLYYGQTYTNLNAAILGNGNTSKGAQTALQKLGANVTVYTREEEEKFKQEFKNYNLIVNAILWDVTRKDHIIYREDLKKMKNNSIIIDISCDKCGGIETSIPTTIEEPIYTIDGIIHYAVDHTPTIFYKDATKSISNVVVNYIDPLVEDINIKELFKEAVVIEKGQIIDEEINKFQGRE